MLIPEAMSAHPSIFQLCRLLDEASIEADQTDLPKLLRVCNCAHAHGFPDAKRPGNARACVDTKSEIMSAP